MKLTRAIVMTALGLWTLPASAQDAQSAMNQNAVNQPAPSLLNVTDVDAQTVSLRAGRFTAQMARNEGETVQQHQVPSPDGATSWLLVSSSQETVVLFVRGTQVSLAWRGRTAFSGDIGEREREVVRTVESRVYVVRERDGVRVCGQAHAAFDVREIVHANGRFRLVPALVPIAQAPTNATSVAATTDAPDGTSAPPDTHLLTWQSSTPHARATDVFSAHRLNASFARARASQVWEAAPGSTRVTWAGAWQAPGVPIESMTIVLPSGFPMDARIALVGDEGMRVEVTDLKPNARNWVRFPTPQSWSCVSMDATIPVGARAPFRVIAIEGYSGLDREAGRQTWLAQLAEGGHDGEAALRALKWLGVDAAPYFLQALPRASQSGRVLIVQWLLGHARGADTHVLPLVEQALIERLSDEALEVRVAAIDALRRLNTPTSVDAIEAIARKDELGSDAAYDALLQLAPPRALDLLVSLPAKITSARMTSTMNSGVAGMHEQIARFVAALESAHVPVEQHAIACAALRTNESMTACASAALSDASSALSFEARYRLLRALNTSQALSESLIAWIRSSLSAEQWMLRGVAYDALFKRGALTDQEKQAWLHDSSPRVREVAFSQPALAVAASDAFASEPWPFVRVAIIRAAVIRSLTTPADQDARAQDLLTRGLRDASRIVREAALEVGIAHRIAALDAPVLAILSNERETIEVRDRAVAYVMTHCVAGAEEGLQLVARQGLRPDVTTEQMQAAVAAIRAMRVLGHTQSVTALTQREGTPPALRDAATRALGRNACGQQ